MPEQWPDCLPLPTLGGMSQSRQNARLERTGETGPPRFRRKFSAVATGASMQVVADTSQTWQLEAFYRDALEEGSLPFLMPDPMQQGKPIANEDAVLLLDGDDSELLLTKMNLCSFGEPPAIQRMAPHYNRITFTVWYLP